MFPGLGGAVGYALGGLDWTHTFLGAIFKSQEQILFVFTAFLFTISVVLHLLSIEEQQYSPQSDRLDQVQNCRTEPKSRVSHRFLIVRFQGNRYLVVFKKVWISRLFCPYTPVICCSLNTCFFLFIKVYFPCFG